VGYKTPHTAREFLLAGALFICHDYKIRCQRRSVALKKELLRQTREIDLCARLAGFFGPTAQIAAQGMTGKKKVDLVVNGPTIRAEVKYFKDAQSFDGKIKRDWEWMLATANTNKEFDKRCWVVFWPSAAADMFTFTNCLSVPKSHGAQYACSDYAPFIPFVEPFLPPNGNLQHLRFRVPPRESLIKIPGGKKVRVDIVGDTTDPLWCSIYSRMPPGETHITEANQYTASPEPILLP
jgi:hypothetical protein